MVERCHESWCPETLEMYGNLEMDRHHALVAGRIDGVLIALALIFGEAPDEDEGAMPTAVRRVTTSVPSRPPTTRPVPTRRAGSNADLRRYCSYKFTPGSYLYDECIADGWKDWYANAH